MRLKDHTENYKAFGRGKKLPNYIKCSMIAESKFILKHQAGFFWITVVITKLLEVTVVLLALYVSDYWTKLQTRIKTFFLRDSHSDFTIGHHFLIRNIRFSSSINLSNSDATRNRHALSKMLVWGLTVISLQAKSMTVLIKKHPSNAQSE